MTKSFNVLSPRVNTPLKITEIKKKNGDVVKKNETIAIADGGDFVMEIKSPAHGTVQNLKISVGETVSSEVLVAKVNSIDDSNDSDDENAKSHHEKSHHKKSTKENSFDEPKKSDIQEKFYNLENQNLNVENSFEKNNQENVHEKNYSDDENENDDDNDDDDDDDKINLKKEDIINAIVENDITRTENFLAQKIAAKNSKGSDESSGFLSKIFGFIKKKNDNNLILAAKEIDISNFTKVQQLFFDEYKNKFLEKITIDAFLIKMLGYALLKTKSFKHDEINFSHFDENNHSFKTRIDDPIKKTFFEIQLALKKKSGISENQKICHIILNECSDIVVLENSNCISFNRSLNNPNKILAIYSKEAFAHDCFLNVFFNYLENPGWIILDLMI